MPNSCKLFNLNLSYTGESVLFLDKQYIGDYDLSCIIRILFVGQLGLNTYVFL
jgi:hypothetical protein